MTHSLVLGGTGFIGLALIQELANKEGHRVTAVDNLERGMMDEEAKKVFSWENLTFIQADLTDPECFLKFNESYDDIYLLAGVVGVRYTIEKPVHVLRTNAMIVTNVVDWWQRQGGRLLYASTSEVYAGSLEVMDNFPTPTPEDVPVAIRDILNPRFSYAASKTYGESLVNAAARESGHPAVIIRFHNIYGPRMGYEHVVPELSLRLIRKEDPFVLYGADQTRAFCYVSDAVTGLISAQDMSSSEPEIFHIGNDSEEIRISELFTHLCEMARWTPGEITHQLAPHGSPNRRCPDISKMRKGLDFEPQVSLASGLAETFNWYYQQHPDGQKPPGR